MTDRITLPPFVIEDARAHPEKYRPEVSGSLVDEARALAVTGPNAGVIGIAYSRDDRKLNIWLGDRMITVSEWLHVGGVEQGPRPEVGGRVLVLATTAVGGGPVGIIGTVRDDTEGEPLIVARGDGYYSPPVTEWALLPVEAMLSPSGDWPEPKAATWETSWTRCPRCPRPVFEDGTHACAVAEDDGMGEATAGRTVGSLTADDRGKSITTDGIPRGGKLVKIEHRSSKTGESRTLLLVHVGGGSTTVDTPSDTPCRVSDGPGETT